MASGLTLKSWFFDRDLVKRSMDAASRESLSKGGNSIKVTAQRSMRYRRKPSAAGTAPSAHKDSKRGPLLREFLFNVWDPSSRSQLIGPQGLGRAIVPQLMEEGGTQAVRVLYPTTPSGRPLSPAAKAAFRRRVVAGAVQQATPQVSYRIATYPARPYMAPAFAKLLPRLPKFFEGSFRKVA